MRRISVPLHGPDDARALLYLAGDLAPPFGAQIEVAFIGDTLAHGEAAIKAAPDAAHARALFEA